VKPLDYLLLAYESARERTWRSLGTIAGISVAVLALAIALGMGASFQSAFVGMLERAFSPDLIYVLPKGELSPSDVALISSLPGVEAVMPIAMSHAVIKSAGGIPAPIYAIEPQYLHYLLGVEDPSDIVDEGVAEMAGSGVLAGKLVAYDLVAGVKRLEVGQQFVVECGGKSVTLTVVGILKAKGLVAGFVNPNSAILMDSNAFFEVFRPSRSYELAVVKVRCVEYVDDLVEQIKAYVPDAEVLDLGFVLEQFRAMTSALQAFLGAVSGIGLLITGLWVFDTMTISVIQRTGEIGLLKALGFKRRQILLLFLSESLLLAGVGTIVGLTIAVAASNIVGLPVFGLVLRPEIRLDIAVLVGALPFLTNFLAALIPSYRAAKLDPVEALRYE